MSILKNPFTLNDVMSVKYRFGRNGWYSKDNKLPLSELTPEELLVCRMAYSLGDGMFYLPQMSTKEEKQGALNMLVEALSREVESWIADDEKTITIPKMKLFGREMYYQDVIHTVLLERGLRLTEHPLNTETHAVNAVSFNSFPGTYDIERCQSFTLQELKHSLDEKIKEYNQNQESELEL